MTAAAVSPPARPPARRLARLPAQFDVPALLDVLAFHGVERDAIELRSVTHVQSQGGAIHDVELYDDARTGARHALVSVHLGLLSASSPLPSFFFQALEQLQGTELADLLGYLDHHLLRERFASLYPERDPAFSGHAPWEETKRALVGELGLASPSSLHWLFSQVFPELSVQATRVPGQRRVPGHDLRLGGFQLGGGAFGGVAAVPAGGVEVTLTSGGTPPGDGDWPGVAHTRVSEQVLPLLDGRELELSVWLRLREPPDPFHLDQSSLGAAALGAPAGAVTTPAPWARPAERRLLLLRLSKPAPTEADPPACR